MTTEQNQLIEHFLEASGYGRSDLLAINYTTRTVMTLNGGIYRVRNSGSVAWVKGPALEPEERD